MRSSFAVNPSLFFLVHEDALVVWDYERHAQYELSLEHARVVLAKDDDPRDDAILRELVESKVLLPREEARPRAWGWDRLSQIFHEGTSLSMPAGFDPDFEGTVREYIEYCGSLADKAPPDAFSYRRGDPSASLAERTPPPALAALCDVLSRRRTSRTMGGTPIALSELALVVGETFGYRDHDHEALRARGLQTPTRRRSSPSGGSLQSCEAYVISQAVSDLPQGLYHYWSDADRLGYLRALPATPRLAQLLGGQAAAEDLSAAVVITCRFEKLWWKYQTSRALRVALMDAGHLSQTMQLIATALGLRTWMTGMFYDPQLREYLGLTETTEYPLLVVALGDAGAPVSSDRYARGGR